MRYIYRCPKCPRTVELHKRDAHPRCLVHTRTDMRRDYRAENVSFGVVPGAYRSTNSRTMFDRDLLKHDGFNFSKEEVEDTRSDFFHRALEPEG